VAISFRERAAEIEGYHNRSGFSGESGEKEKYLRFSGQPTGENKERGVREKSLCLVPTKKEFGLNHQFSDEERGSESERVEAKAGVIVTQEQGEGR